LYANVQIRNWTSFDRLKLAAADCRNMYWLSVELDYPVSMGKYKFPESPDEPMVLHLPRALTKPGLSPRDQGRAGRTELMGTTFGQMERATRDQLARVLGGGGFDPERTPPAGPPTRRAHPGARSASRRVLGTIYPENRPGMRLVAKLGYQRIGLIGYVALGARRRDFCRMPDGALAPGAEPS
jgi:hypothetical protein